ncbi:MAG: FMN-binding glutamate synthase family protein [Bacteriovoracaceae bacterium]|nr:FMN-binding glutamate synthase family protein [Bacteriovoracaceae bacterium]
MRREFFLFAIIGSLICAIGFWVLPPLYHPLHITITSLFALIVFIGLKDAFQTKHTILRNFPVLGKFRYLLEMVRPEIQQYFIESNSDGRPFNREDRSLVYQRSKGDLDTLPFGTQKDVYAPGYQWVNHSIKARHLDHESMRVTIGGESCSQPYSASILNISAMSYGSLSGSAIQALNGGAQEGNFAHNTGEGGISPHHLKHKGDLIWQVGTGYFGCRHPDGSFNPEMFKENATRPEVKMIEIKISQGAKPGHGGILPARKITPEIAAIRGVPMGQDVLSPPTHSTFDTPIGLLNFVAQLRELSGGKPVGFKLCLGKRREFMAICKAMMKTQIFPDYIAVDGGEGGTGAAPIEFSNHIGSPGLDSLVYVHNCLVGFGIRNKMKIITSGKIASAFDLMKRLCLGADVCYAARSMMLALGCIQALRCNSNHCPAGVATNDPNLEAGLVVSHKRGRVASFHKETMKSFAHMLGAMGLGHPDELRPWHLQMRTGASEVKHFGQIFHYLEEGELLQETMPAEFMWAFRLASAESFDPADTLTITEMR